MIDSIGNIISLIFSFSYLEIRSIRLKDSSVDIMASGSSKRKEADSIKFENLSPHKMDYGRPYPMDLSTVPLFNRVGIQSVVILMIAINEKSSKRFALEPIEQPPFKTALRVFIPYTAEIPDNDTEIILSHFLLLRKNLYVESLKLSVAVSCDVNHSASVLYYKKILLHRPSAILPFLTFGIFQFSEYISGYPLYYVHPVHNR